MADLLIKGVDMPKDGDYLFSFASDEYGGNTVCRIERVGGGLIEHYGIVMLPTHGRLIDADELLKRKGDCYDHEGHLLYAVGTGDIMLAPTVIEASEDGEQDG